MTPAKDYYASDHNHAYKTATPSAARKALLNPPVASNTPGAAQPGDISFDLDKALEYLTDPIANSPAEGKEIQGIVTIHVDDSFMCGTPYFKQKIIESLKRDFQVGSEDNNDIAFVGQRIKWINKGTKNEYKEYVYGVYDVSKGMGIIENEPNWKSLGSGRYSHTVGYGTITDKQLIAIKELVYIYIKRYPDIKFFGHNQTAAKACPWWWTPTFLEYVLE